MVRKLKKTITPPDSLTMWAALLSDIIHRLAFCPDWNKSQLSFVLFVLGLTFRSDSPGEECQ